MSLRQLKSCLNNQMHRTTPVDEMPPDNTPDWVAQKLRDKNAQYAREHEREERRQRRELEKQARGE